LDTLFYLGFIFVFGAFIKMFCQKIKILYVVGYLIFGYLIGPNVFNIIPKSFIYESNIITELSLSIISVLVGSSLKYKSLKSLSKQISLISFFEAIVTFCLVSIAFYLLLSTMSLFNTKEDIAVALLFGGLAIATAPATILAIIHELEPKKRIQQILLGIVALDNAFALIIFSLILALSTFILGEQNNILSSIFEIFPKFIFSIIIGVLGGLITNFIDKLYIKTQTLKTTSTLGMVFIVFSICNNYNLEPLLATLVMGITMANVSKEFALVKEEFDNHLKDIIFLLFFTFSAMHMKLELIYKMPWIIVTYVLFRSLGKFFGTRLGANISHAHIDAQKYLGLALFPQAGIAIGLALSIQEIGSLKDVAPIILDVIIATTIIHELIGPVFTKYAIKKTQK